MLKISYQLEKNSFGAAEIAKAAHKVQAMDIGTYAKTYTDFVEEVNKLLQEAFDAGREFERCYKPEEE